MKERKISRIIRAFTVFAAVLVLAATAFGCAKKPDDDTPVIPGGTVAPDPAWSEEYNLPDADAAYERLKEIYGGEEKIFLLQNGKIARMPCPENGEYMSLNITFDVDKYTRIVLEDCVAEFNDVFGVINPNYRFQIRYAPKDGDFESKYSIRVRSVENLGTTESSTVFGTAHVSYYDNFTTLGDFGINLKSEVLTNGSYLMTTFKHELMHLLGAGDAYKNPSATKNTVMQSYTVNGCHSFSESDVAFIDALYRNPKNPHTDEYIKNYISEYETSTVRTKFNNTSKVYRALADATDTAELKKQIEAVGYKDTRGLTSLIGKSLNRDKDFGKTDIAFAELEYDERPAETYFGSFTDGVYRHGRDKGTLQSTETPIGNYTDYGEGVLYSAPNGNKYTVFVKIGDYVLLLKLEGSFTALNKLDLSLRHACAVS